MEINNSSLITNIDNKLVKIIGENSNIFFHNLKSCSVEIDVEKSCKIFFLINNISSNYDFKINIKNKFLDVQIKIISLIKNNEILNFNISIIHQAQNTTCNFTFLGFALENSNLKIKAKNKILNGMKQSTTHQLIKILTDNNAIALAEPGLMIDDFDVVASHGNSIGQINQKLIYYLQSKGISKNNAKWMIIEGNIKSLFKDTNIEQNFISDFIKNLKKQLGADYE